MSFPTLETPRLRLRELTLDDAPALLAIHGDGPAMRYFGTEPLTTLAQAEALVHKFAAWRQQPHPGVRWGLERCVDGALVGSCGLFGWNRDWGKCSAGYELAASARGQGLMREALQAAFGWGFATMNLHRIEAQIHPDNAPSLALAEGLGFVREGRLREAGFWSGQRHDLWQLGLLRTDWAPS